MPRRSSGARLWWDRKRETWTIIDGRARHRTGCGASEAGRAEQALRDYITGKHKPAAGPDPLLADVIATYAEEHIKHAIAGKHIQYDLRHLNKWWGTKKVSDISAVTCRAYVTGRNAGASSRRELAFLNAAIAHWKAHHAPQMATPKIVLPPAPESRKHWITRDEAAQFLRHARKTPHLARFFIIGWYTGSRRSVISGMKWSMIDFKTKIMQRKPPGARQAKNKQAPPVRMGSRLIAHLKRWKRMDGKKAEYLICYQGKRVKNPIRIWNETREAAGLPEYVTPHILRHTRATNMLQQRKDPVEASKALGMSLSMLMRVYGHHHPDWQKDVSETR
jgi:integrase